MTSVSSPMRRRRSSTSRPPRARTSLASSRGCSTNPGIRSSARPTWCETDRRVLLLRRDFGNFDLGQGGHDGMHAYFDVSKAGDSCAAVNSALKKSGESPVEDQPELCNDRVAPRCCG